jgi:hypothetical protein
VARRRPPPVQRRRRRGEQPDIDARAKDVADYLSSRRTSGTILPELVAARDAMSSTARRYLREQVEAEAARCRKRAEAERQRAERLEQYAAELSTPSAVKTAGPS